MAVGRTCSWASNHASRYLAAQFSALGLQPAGVDGFMQRVGFVELQLSSPAEPSETRRRVNRIATLDGGVVFTEGGYTHADRTITLTWAVRSVAEEASVARLLELYTRLRLAMDRAVYLVAPEVYAPGPTESQLTLLVVEQMNE
jgi:hypothetical protein